MPGYRLHPRDKTSIVLDLSMNVANRTAVHHMGHEIYGVADGRLTVRYWRFFRNRPIDFTGNSLIFYTGRVIARLMHKDIDSPWTGTWPRRAGSKMLFLEALFSIKTAVEEQDIVVCHDIAPITHAQYYSARTRHAYDTVYRRIARAAPAIVFVSDYTKREFLKKYPANYRRTEVIPLYCKPSLAKQDSRRSRRRPYILMVGSLEKRKNFSAALVAFRESGLSANGYALVIAGPRGNLSAELLPKLASYGNVEHVGFVTDAELGELYQGADALFFPSLAEGFGVPALEAPQLGVLPIVSRDTVLEEIAGPASILVDPASVGSMAAGLREAAAMDTASKDARLSRIREHQRRFSLANFHSAWAALLREEASSGPIQMIEQNQPLAGQHDDDRPRAQA